MAWPIDARDFDFAALKYVPSATLNEMQDRIIDLHRERTRVFWPTVYENQTGGAADHMGWTPNASTVPWLGCLEASRDLWIPIQLDDTAVITGVEVKCYKTADGIRAYLDKVDVLIDTPATVPTFSNLSAPAASAGGSPCWEVIDLASGLPVTLGEEEILLVRIGSAAVGDMCAGALVTYQPLTPT